MLNQRYLSLCLRQSRRCESPAVTGAGDVLLPSSALPKPSTPAAAVPLLPTRHSMPPEVDEEDEDEYTVMDIRWGQLTQGGPSVPIEVSETACYPATATLKARLLCI